MIYGKTYEDVVHDFDKSFNENKHKKPLDSELLEMAIIVFCMESLDEIIDINKMSIRQKAAYLVANRLMDFPKSHSDWQINFPYVWGESENCYSQDEMKNADVALKVWSLVKNGEKVTHAIAKVAVDTKFSPQKVAKDYYHWKDHHDTIDALHNGANLIIKKSSKT